MPKLNGDEAAHSVRSLSPEGRGLGRGGSNLSRNLGPLTPPLSDRKGVHARLRRAMGEREQAADAAAPSLTRNDRERMPLRSGHLGRNLADLLDPELHGVAGLQELA